MTRPLALCLLLVSACHHEKPATTPPADGGKTEPVIPSSDPTGNECVARCLEGDTHKDVTVDEREAACRADCPTEAPAEGEGDAATEPPA